VEIVIIPSRLKSCTGHSRSNVNACHTAGCSPTHERGGCLPLQQSASCQILHLYFIGACIKWLRAVEGKKNKERKVTQVAKVSYASINRKETHLLKDPYKSFLFCQCVSFSFIDAGSFTACVKVCHRWYHRWYQRNFETNLVGLVTSGDLEPPDPEGGWLPPAPLKAQL